jgi:predicted SAM-dependent methyltransferase
MRSQKLKDIYYASIGKLSIFPYYWHKVRHSSKFYGAYVNIGCGPKYVAGMINIDGNIFYKKDIWLDVTLGLPFPDSSLKGVYVSHVLEHFSPEQLRNLLAEFYRVLQPGGGVRIVVPSLEYAVRAYQEGEGKRFPDWPEKYTSLGGRLNNFLLCSNQHRLMFDFSFLEELLKEARFSRIYREVASHSSYFGEDHLQFESDPSIIDSSLFVEAIK